MLKEEADESIHTEQEREGEERGSEKSRKDIQIYTEDKVKRERRKWKILTLYSIGTMHVPE